MSTVPVLDLSRLPASALGHRSLTWWGTILFLTIEGTMLGGLIASYFYLYMRVPAWPPGVQAPPIFWPMLTTALFVVSSVPNYLTVKAAREYRLPELRVWLVATAAVGAAATGLRATEFAALYVSWDTNAYGSIVWALVGFHFAHALTDVVDSVVLAVLMFKGPLEMRRFADVEENGIYWYAVVLFGVAVTLVVYVAPRWI